MVIGICGGVVNWHSTFVSSLIVSPFWRKPLRAPFSSERLAASKGWNEYTFIGWLYKIFTEKIIQLIPLKFLTCNRYFLFEAEIQQKYIIYVHPFYTWAVVTEHRTSPRCALIILPKAVITSPVRGRRPLSAKTSAKQKKGNVWARFTLLILCISYCWPGAEKHYAVRHYTVRSTHIVIHHFKIIIVFVISPN